MNEQTVKISRRVYPPRGYLISIAFTEWGRFLALGDVAAVIPRFQVRVHPGAVQRINNLQYVSMHVLRSWVDQALRADKADLAGALEDLIEWACGQEHEPMPYEVPR